MSLDETSDSVGQQITEMQVHDTDLKDKENHELDNKNDEMPVDKSSSMA